MHRTCFLIFLLIFTSSVLAQSDRTVLLSPQPAEVLDNGCQDKTDPVLWLFKWAEVPGAKRYHLYVTHKGAVYPVINEQSVGIPSYADYSEGSYIAEHNLGDWSWRVRALVDNAWTDWSEERTFNVEPLNTDCVDVVESPTDATALSVPAQVYPPNGSVFSNYPRLTVLVWEKVPGAVSYTLELDCFHCCGRDKWCTDVGTTWRVILNLKHPAYKFHFVGAQPGRWRVWAVGADRQPGPKSEWSEFRYTR